MTSYCMICRSYYLKKYCPAINTEYDYKDVMLDSSRFGVDDTAEIIAGIAKTIHGFNVHANLI